MRYVGQFVAWNRSDGAQPGGQYSPEGYRLVTFESLEDFSVVRIVHLKRNGSHAVESSGNQDLPHNCRKDLQRVSARWACLVPSVRVFVVEGDC